MNDKKRVLILCTGNSVVVRWRKDCYDTMQGSALKCIAPAQSPAPSGPKR
jgi:hypothetical protein